MQKLFAIVVIWVGCAAAWMLLGSTIVYRGGDTRSELDGEVYRLWGPPTVQAPPSGLVHAVELEEPSTREEQERAEGGPAPLVASDIDVALELEHRKKGLLWFATYAADFSARYTFKNPSVEDRDVTVTFPLAGAGLIYDAFEILDGEGKPVDAAISGHAATWTERFSAGDERSYQVIYRSRGIESWSYNAPPTPPRSRISSCASPSTRPPSTSRRAPSRRPSMPSTGARGTAPGTSTAWSPPRPSASSSPRRSTRVLSPRRSPSSLR